MHYTIWLSCLHWFNLYNGNLNFLISDESKQACYSIGIPNLAMRDTVYQFFLALFWGTVGNFNFMNEYFFFYFLSDIGMFSLNKPCKGNKKPQYLRAELSFLGILKAVCYYFRIFLINIFLIVNNCLYIQKLNMAYHLI